jgi:hypothetical protein
VIDNLSPSLDFPTGHRHTVRVTVNEQGLTDLETVILRMVKDDPFTTILEMKRTLNGKPREAPVGWWQIFSILRKRRLLTKRARFRFIRGQW